MGCAPSDCPAVEPAIETLPVLTIYQPKKEVYLDAIQLETELLALRKNASEAIYESEFMKTQIDIVNSNAHPQLFANAQEVSELISDWQELDLRDGDNLLESLMRVWPKSVEEGQKLQAESFKIRNKDAQLKDYLAYFAQRFALFNASWGEILSVWREYEEHATILKSDLANDIQSVEVFLGKKSADVEAIQCEFRRLLRLDTTAFITQQHELRVKLNECKAKMTAKKLEDKETERVRQVTMLESDFTRVNGDYTKELTSSNAKVAAAEATLKKNLETKYEAIIEEYKAKEKVLLSQVQMLGEDQLSGNVRIYSEKHLMENELKDEIDLRIKEVKQLKQTHKQEKITNAMQFQKEVNQLKRERDQKIKDMQKSMNAYKEEIQRLNSMYAEDRSLQQSKHFAELKNRDVLLAELREEFMNKIDHQKTFYEEKMTQDREKYQSELQDANEKITNLMREMTLKITLQRGFERSNANDIEKQVIKLTQEKEEMEQLYSKTIADLESKIRFLEIETSQNDSHDDHFAEMEAMRVEYDAEIQKIRTVEREKTRKAEELVMNLEKEKAQLKMEIESQHLDSLRKSQERYGKNMQEMEAAMQREKHSLQQKAQKDESEIRRLEGQIKDLNTKIADTTRKMTEDNSHLRSKLELEVFRNKKTNDFLRDKESELRIFQKESETFKQQYAKATSANLEKETQISDLRTQVFNSNKRAADLEVHTESLIKQLQAAQLIEQELRQSQATGKLSISGGPGQEDAVNRILEDLSHRDAKIRELAENQRSKEVEFQGLEQKRRLKSSLAMIGGTIQSMKQTAFLIWKFSKLASMSSVAPLAIPGRQKPTPTSSTVLTDSQELENLFNEEKRMLLEKNPLLAIHRAITRAEKPLTIQQTMILLDEVLESKFALDYGGEMSGKKPASLAEFTIAHFTRKFGHEKLAHKTIGQALLCLLTLIKESNQYAEMIGKLFCFGNSDPLSLEFSLFFEKMRVDFEGFVEHFSEKYPKKRDEYVLNGGMAFLVDVLSYVYDVFEDDKNSGEKIIKMLQPRDASLDAYVIFHVCHKIAKTGLNADGLFELIDLDKNGEIEQSEFVTSISTNLHLWVSPEDLNQVFGIITNGSSVINKSLFLSKFNFKTYLENAQTEKFAVAKSEFMKILAEVYANRERQIAGELISMLGKDSEEIVTVEKFREVVNGLDPEITPERVNLIWRAAEEIASQRNVYRKAATRALLKFKVGRYAASAFCNPYSDNPVFDPTIHNLISETASEIMLNISEPQSADVFDSSQSFGRESRRRL